MNHIAAQTSAPTWARPATPAGPDPRRWLILAVVALAQLMVVLDSIFPCFNTDMACHTRSHASFS
jgi:hypothetical protein